MIININDNEIIIEKPVNFIARHILDCGQIFRYKDLGDCYEVLSQDKKCRVFSEEDCIRIVTSDTDYFYNYFDLSTDYNEIIDKLNESYNINDATEFGKGIRILRQAPYETIINFIISANNNIPRIKGIIDRISTSLGDKCEGYYAFPTPDQMVNAGIDFYKSIGAGYRAEYIYNTAKAISEGFNLDITGMETAEAKIHLLKLKGVGPKVADCILLFAYYRMDVFPVDTWITKIYLSECNDCTSKNNMSKYLVNKYKMLSGFAQQYLFYFIREKKI